LDIAKKEVSEDLPFVLVEGQLDAIRCWTIGLPAIAPQGTSVTEGQLLLLKRFNERVICLLDGDKAGRKAAIRVLPMAWKAGLDIQFYALPEGADPDDIILEKGEAFKKEILEKASGALSFGVHALLPEPRSAEPREKNRAANGIFELLTYLDSELMRMEYLGELSRLLGIREDILSIDFKSYQTTKARRTYISEETEVSHETGNSPESKSKLTNAEEDLILALFEFPDLGKHLFQVVDNEWIDDSKASGRILNRILAEAEQGSWLGINQMEEIVETEEERNYYYDLRSKEIQADNLVRGAEESVVKLFKRYIHKQLNTIDSELIKSESLPLEEQLRLQRERIKLRRSLSTTPALEFPSDF
jgi:DNA primase